MWRKNALWAALFVILVLRLGLWAKRRNEAYDLCAQAETAKELSILGTFVRKEGESAEIRSALWARVVVSRGVDGIESGTRVRLRSPYRCPPVLVNPALLQDGLLFFQQPKIVLLRPVVLSIERRSSFETILRKIFAPFPNVWALERALWIGDAKGLPAAIQRLYLEGGLLQLIALSGQHVAGLVLVMNLFLGAVARAWMAFQGTLRTRYLAHARALLPLGAATLLWITSYEIPTMGRTLAMTGSAYLLSRMGRKTTKFQWLCSSVAGVLILSPESIASIGFLLSVVATGFCLESTSPKKYIGMSLLIPVLMLPVSAFFFGKAPWTSPLHSLVLSWLWDLFLVPVGFALFPLGFLFPERVWHWIDSGIYHVWRGHEVLEAYLPSFYRLTLRPTWVELILVLALLIRAPNAWVQKRPLVP